MEVEREWSELGEEAERDGPSIRHCCLLRKAKAILSVDSFRASLLITLIKLELSTGTSTRLLVSSLVPW